MMQQLDARWPRLVSNQRRRAREPPRRPGPQAPGGTARVSPTTSGLAAIAGQISLIHRNRSHNLAPRNIADAQNRQATVFTTVYKPAPRIDR